MARSNDAARPGRATRRPLARASDPGAPSADGQNAAAVGRPAQSRELRARGKRTMRKLLDAGVEIFARRGYHQARVDDIVKLAKTSHGTFYLYFANKEDLFRALAHEVAEEMSALAEQLPALEPDAAGYEALCDWLERFAQLYERYGPVIRAWTEAEIGGSEFGRLGADVLTEFSRVLAGRIRDVAPPDLDPAIGALALVAMIERLNYFVLAKQVTVSRKALVETLTVATHAALFGATVTDGSRARARR